MQQTEAERIAAGKWRIRIKRGKSNDPEKMVLPGIVFCHRAFANVCGFALAVGWWDYHITLLFTRTALQNKPETS